MKKTTFNRKPLYAALVGSAVAMAAATTPASAGIVNPQAQPQPLMLASGCNPCNPCAAKKNPCNPCNPCAAKKACNPCNPCAAKKACNPCAAKKNPCNPCNPCAAKKTSG